MTLGPHHFAGKTKPESSKKILRRIRATNELCNEQLLFLTHSTDHMYPFSYPSRCMPLCMSRTKPFPCSKMIDLEQKVLL